MDASTVSGPVTCTCITPSIAPGSTTDACMQLRFDLPDAIVQIYTPPGQKVGTMTGVHKRTADDTPGRFLYGYHWDAHGLLGPYYQG